MRSNIQFCSIFCNGSVESVPLCPICDWIEKQQQQQLINLMSFEQRTPEKSFHFSISACVPKFKLCSNVRVDDAFPSMTLMNN